MGYWENLWNLSDYILEVTYVAVYITYETNKIFFIFIYLLSYLFLNTI